MFDVLALKREGASSLRTAKDFFSGLKKLEKCVAKRKGRQYLWSTEKAHIAGGQSSINGGGEVVLYEAPDG